jgi:hypothetical protein
MKSTYRTLISFFVCLAVSVSLNAYASSDTEVFVVSAGLTGNSSYMVSNGDGTFSEQKVLQNSIGSNITGRTYGNGIGDFDGDGDLDYLMALGREIYLFKNTVMEDPDFGIQFDGPKQIGASEIGNFPADIAIADYNEDGNLDFVLSYYLSPHCGLYLGNGDLGFEYHILENTAEKFSIGIDAADINNDGHADFVVAPNAYYEPYYVNLGDGHGSFQTIHSIRNDGTKKFFGIAAADFDGDGLVDLAASSKNFLEIYTGNGKGTFEWLISYELAMNSSPIDNGDFDGDGHQDLVAANFDQDMAGIAVFLGDGQGGFTHLDTYLGGDTMQRKSVAALPYVLNQNPVAYLTPEIVHVTVGETVEWDASNSFDDDGMIVSYAWDFGDGTFPAVRSLSKSNSGAAKVSVEPGSSYVYYDVGTYYVTLTVTDDLGATAIAQAEVHVEAIPAVVYFSPHWLNLDGKGKWLMATIRVPSDYDAGLIDPDRVFIVPENGPAIAARSLYKNSYLSKRRNWRSRKKRQLTVIFDRQAVIKTVNGVTGKTTLSVVGDIISKGVELEFSGSGTINTYKKKKRISPFKKYLMQQILHFITRSGSKSSRYSRS